MMKTQMVSCNELYLLVPIWQKLEMSMRFHWRLNIIGWRLLNYLQLAGLHCIVERLSDKHSGTNDVRAQETFGKMLWPNQITNSVLTTKYVEENTKSSDGKTQIGLSNMC